MQLSIKPCLFSFLLVVVTASILKAQPNWTINANDFETSMTYTSIVRIEGIEKNDSLDQIAAWYNGQLRGTAKPISISGAYDKYYLFVIYSNSSEQIDRLSFTFYNSENDSIYELINTESFVPNQNKGTYEYPFVFENSRQVGILSPTSDEKITVEVFPNPCSDFLNVQTSDVIQSMEITNLQGQLLIQQIGPNNIINVSTLPYGYYLLRVSTAEGDVTKKILVN